MKGSLMSYYYQSAQRTMTTGLQSGVKYLRLLNLRYSNLKKMVVLIAVIQLFTLVYFYQNNYSSFDNAIFSSSTITRFSADQIEIDSTLLPTLIKRYLSLHPNLLTDTLYHNCVNFFESSNNTRDFYKSFDGVNYHLEQYGSNFYGDVLEQVQRRYKDQNKEISMVNDDTDVLPLMDQYRDENKKYEENILNIYAKLRVYGKCFIDNRIKFDNVQEYETKLFPYLSQSLPVFENYKNDHVPFPKYAKRKTPPYSNSFLQKFQGKLNGRGIVLSIGDKLVDETCQLFKVLRYLNNTLPIQLVHNDELSDKSKAMLFDTAISGDVKGPKQDLLIVNVSPCLTPEYKSRFQGFNSKWLAVLFNSFEEMILMDNDLVPFINPVRFFTDFAGYNSSGTFFFRDRESFERINKGSQELINKILPTQIENYLFDVPLSPHEVLAAKYHLFDYGAKHFMESGIVVMNKRKNFKGLLTSVNTQLLGGVTHQFYGDKEIFWLGQIFSGNDNIYFNTHAAGNIGKFEDVSKLAKTIQSIQPAHISPLDDHTLLWVNSGLKNCKKNTAMEDFDNIYLPKQDSKFKSITDLENYYNSPLEVEGVIIPPNSNKDWNNLMNEPSRGFHQIDNQGCGGYYWNAYSRVGTPNDPKELTVGLTVEFSELERQYIKEIEQVWIN